jgi:hypothetical protein
MKINQETRTLQDVIKLCSLRPTKDYIKGQDELIESIYMGLPLRGFLMEKTIKQWVILTGKQRMQIITNFFYNGFMLHDVRLDKSLELQCFSTLKYKDRFVNTQIMCYFLTYTSKINKPVIIEMAENWL